jgi:hypothetical protein
VLCLGAAGPASGYEVTARNPLLPPLFSIDPMSPEVTDGPLLPGDLLLPGDPNLPEVVIPAEGLFLLDADDDLDALAFGPWPGTPTTTFVMIFSVDRMAMGGVPPDPTLVSMGFPFSAQDQAEKNQAAGDAYMSLLLFTEQGAIPPLRGSFGENNTLVINQGDAGGVHFQLSPEDESPETQQDPNEPQSNANGGSGTQPPAAAAGRRVPSMVLYSLTSDSPSLSILPGSGSGADIYVDQDPFLPGEGEGLYVGAALLGLMAGDDIDAMLVIDALGDGHFSPGVDQIIFSLAPGSPSLQGPLGPGDLLKSYGDDSFSVFCSAEALGLTPWDNLNMLDYVFCDDVLTAVEQWAIGYVQCTGDLDEDGDVDLVDLGMLLGSYGLCEGDAGFIPAADFDGTNCVELADLSTLLSNYGEVCW